MIVDDSAVDRRLAGGLLEKHDWSVHYAAGGKEALEQMAARLPDVIVTDLHMPEMNGLELVAAIKKDYPPVPVILMTAIGSEDVAAQALREGAASYVPKRRLAADLLPTVQRILRGALEDRAQPLLMHYMEACSLSFVLRNDLGLLHATVNHLQPMLRCLPLADETERVRVSIALEEALNNSYYHGNLEVGAALGRADRQSYERLAAERLWQPPYCDRQIRLTANISRQEAVFIVSDDGPGFDVSKLPAALSADGDQGIGRGIFLMRSIMDEANFNDAGNQVTLIKRRVVEPVEGGDQ
jgi:CheY-like chemotaxis protein/anti-sigma regulatory factor (Ser/Thr protein kinase)